MCLHIFDQFSRHKDSAELFQLYSSILYHIVNRKYLAALSVPMQQFLVALAHTKASRKTLDGEVDKHHFSFSRTASFLGRETFHSSGRPTELEGSTRSSTPCLVSDQAVPRVSRGEHPLVHLTSIGKRVFK